MCIRCLSLHTHWPGIRDDGTGKRSSGEGEAEPWRRVVLCNWLIVMGLQKDALLQTVFRRGLEQGVFLQGVVSRVVM